MLTIAFSGPIRLSRWKIYCNPAEREVAAAHSRYFGNTDLWKTLQPLAQNRSLDQLKGFTLNS